MSDSAGTHGYHIGCAPDQRSIKVGLSRGIDISSLKARRFNKNDANRFDLILAMDRGHLCAMQDFVAPENPDKIKLFSDYLSDNSDSFQDVIDIPDPYYDDEEAFEDVYDLVAAGVDGIVKKLQDAELIWDILNMFYIKNTD